MSETERTLLGFKIFDRIFPPFWPTMNFLILLWSIALLVQRATHALYNPHEPMIWQLINDLESKIIQEYQGPGSNWNFTAHLFSLIPIDQGGCYGETCSQVSKFSAQCKAFYMCPASNPGRSYCNTPNHYFCSYWGCETIASNWKTRGDPYINVTWGPPGCQPPRHDYAGGTNSCGGRNTCWRLEIKVKNLDDFSWGVGRTWGIRYWEPGTDRGSIFRIIRKPMPHDISTVIGPNRAMEPFSGKRQGADMALTSVTNQNLDTSVTPEMTTGPVVLQDPNTMSQFSENSLWNIMRAAYLALNNTQPALTNECWLCYSIRPPYYEAIGHPHKVQWKNGTNPAECPWNKNNTQGLTIQHVTGHGKCVGKVPGRFKHLCNSTILKDKIEEKKNKSVDWLIPTKGAKWLCSDVGLTPCISLKVFDPTQFCVQVIIVPRLTYHTDEEVLFRMENGLQRQKREPITVITLATLLTAGGVGAGTGIASIVKSEEIQTLQRAVDEDLDRIEQATSVKSLSEVVLQNHRGLDLTFLKDGGLCVALNEECCSFVDHTGMVKNSMAELQKRLEKRKRDREMGKTWYEGWFNMSPWLTTLLSAIAGPLILLLLAFLFGPCILRCLTNFIEKRFEATKLLILAAPRNEYRDDVQPPSINLEDYKNGTNI